MEYHDDHLQCAVRKLQDKLMSAQNMLNQEIAICEELKIQRTKWSEEQCEKIDQVMELFPKDELKKSVTDNLEKELSHLTTVIEMLQDPHRDALVAAEGLEKIQKLREVDMMEFIPLLTENINAIYNKPIPSWCITNIILNTAETIPPALFNRTKIGKFQERFNADLKPGKLNRGCVFKIHDSSFRLDIKRWKDYICNSSFRRDCENSRVPVDHLGVYFSIGDGCSTPVEALIRVYLLRYGLSHDKAMTEIKAFTFEYPGSGDGWSRFLTWDQVNDPEERFVLFGEMIFNIFIAVKET
ncbi:hypothetical protein SNE40_022505 [Patella caerulea]|uniref:Uncharacterized protein n=1 Tax=Patella caerulea TaxID=87958 RepID=A0AAN8FWJ3_PATCE